MNTVLQLDVRWTYIETQAVQHSGAILIELVGFRSQHLLDLLVADYTNTTTSKSFLIDSIFDSVVLRDSTSTKVELGSDISGQAWTQRITDRGLFTE